ncbi:MAG: hypothetical protein HRT81_09555 [Henriciella sp.]|nr:hypothetical protein [Henriciella sp.]
MKRAALTFLVCILWCPQQTTASHIYGNLAHSQSARFTLIDARNGLTPDVKAAYAEAMGATAQNPYIHSRIKVIASPKHGANFDPVEIPDQVRVVDVEVDLILFGGQPSAQPIDLNHLRVARHAPHRITQKTTIRGR